MKAKNKIKLMKVQISELFKRVELVEDRAKVANAALAASEARLKQAEIAKKLLQARIRAGA